MLLVENLTPDKEHIRADFEAQCRNVLDLAGEKIANAGMGWKDFIWAKVQLVGMNENFRLYNDYWKDRFENVGPAFLPCRTTAARTALPSGASIQMDFMVCEKTERNFAVRNSERAPDAVGLYQHAIEMNGKLYISGIGPRVKGSKDIPGVAPGETKIPPVSYDIEPQIRSVFNNITFILNDAGFEWSDLKGGRFYLTNMEKDYPAFKRVWNEYWNGNPVFEPEMMEVSALPTTINAEMDCYAVKEPKP